MLWGRLMRGRRRYKSSWQEPMIAGSIAAGLVVVVFLIVQVKEAI